jgi:hypothetical protein
MTTKAPAKIKDADSSDPLKKIYTVVEELTDVIPITNDRYRLAFNLHKFYVGEAASIDEAVKTTKVDTSLDLEDLIKRVEEKYKSLNLS